MYNIDGDDNEKVRGRVWGEERDKGKEKEEVQKNVFIQKLGLL